MILSRAHTHYNVCRMCQFQGLFSLPFTQARLTVLFVLFLGKNDLIDSVRGGALPSNWEMET